MSELRVRLFGPGAVTVDGSPVKLKPLTMTVLIRLIVANGAPVAVDEIYRDCWPSAGFVFGDYKTQVQKRVLEIRRVVDPGWSSESGQRSQALPAERGRITAYRLVIDREAIDVFQFIEFAAQARRVTPEEGIGLLEQAIRLWTGPPLLDVADKTWADALIRQLNGLRRSAVQELAHTYERAGRTHDALDVAEELAAGAPEDTRLAAWMETLRGEVRTSRTTRTCREDFADLKTAVVVTTGDLFAQDDANLVAGFCDTFDTDTDRNIVISSESTQGMLLRTLYGGDRGRLDKELKAALARVPRVAVEPRSAKPRGKLIRYPVGTVATLYHATRRVFAVAYSQMGNDLMAQSSLPMLRLSLDSLWDAVYRHGQLKPVAIPLIGSSLSRTGGSDEELLTMILRSFLASSRARYLGPELRVVISQPLFAQIKISEVLKAVRDGGRVAPERVLGRIRGRVRQQHQGCRDPRP
jgi:DNA-binding SARP family transcriptional activator